ncbi:MAG: phosphopantetheine-binding protein, partial [Cyclobacteriaceae bacterium]
RELVAYLTGSEEQHTGDLRAYLKGRLPGYMVPTYFVQLEALPLTANGKIEKKGLPSPEGLMLNSGVKYVAPQSKLQQRLIEIWQKVLQRKKIGILDNFFAMGGNSMRAIKLLSELKTLNEEIKLMDIYSYNTPLDFAKFLNGNSDRVSSKEIILLNEYSASKTNILLLPPIMGQAVIFRKLAETMISRFNVYSIDYQMYVTEHTSSIEELSEAIFKSFYKEINGETAIIGGYSIGSRIASEVSKLFQEKERLIGSVMIEGLSQNNGVKLNNEENYFREYIATLDGSTGDEFEYYQETFKKLIQVDSKYHFTEKLNTDVISFYAADGEIVNIEDNEITNKAHIKKIIKGDHNSILNFNNEPIFDGILKLLELKSD